MPDGGFLNFNFDWGDISTGSRKCLATFSYTAMVVKNTPPRVVLHLSSLCLNIWLNTVARVV